MYDLTSKIFEDAAAGSTGGTTMGAVAYTPGGFGDVKRKLNTLKNKSYNLNIIEDTLNKSRRVSFNNDFHYDVNDDHWNEFLEKVLDGRIEGPLVMAELFEALGDEYDAAINHLQEVLIEAYDIAPLENLDSNILKFKNLFGLGQYLKKKTLVDYQDKANDLYRVLKAIKKAYPTDVGYLQLIGKALEEKTPLTMFAPFKSYDLMYGVRIRSSYEKVQLILDVGVDSTFEIQETLYVKDRDDVVLDELTNRTRVVVKKEQVFPRGKKFDDNFFNVLKDVIDDTLDIENEDAY